MGHQVIKSPTRLRGFYQESMSSADTRMAMEQGVGISSSLLFLKTSRAVATSFLMISKSRVGMSLTTLICCSRIFLLQKTSPMQPPFPTIPSLPLSLTYCPNWVSLMGRRSARSLDKLWNQLQVTLSPLNAAALYSAGVTQWGIVSARRATLDLLAPTLTQTTLSYC